MINTCRKSCCEYVKWNIFIQCSFTSYISTLKFKGFCHTQANRHVVDDMILDLDLILMTWLRPNCMYFMIYRVKNVAAITLQYCSSTFDFQLIKPRLENKFRIFAFSAQPPNFNLRPPLVISADLFINQSKLCFSDKNFKLYASKLRPEQFRVVFFFFFFFPFLSTTPRWSSNLRFSPVISDQPLIYQVIYSYIYLKYRSIVSDPSAPSSDSPFRDGAQAIPPEWGNAGQRQSLLGKGGVGGQFSQRDSVKRVIILW